MRIEQQVLNSQGYSYYIRTTYLQHMKQFVAYYKKKSPDSLPVRHRLKKCNRHSLRHSFLMRLLESGEVLRMHSGLLYKSKIKPKMSRGN